MNDMSSLPLGSIEAVRPVFMIVMGIFLWVVAWRICKSTDGWTARLIASGALMLGFGYAVMIPLYGAGVIENFSQGHGNSASALAWHAVKLLLMNGGWLTFGLGLAMHAGIFAKPLSPRKLTPSPLPREFAA